MYLLYVRFALFLSLSRTLFRIVGVAVGRGCCFKPQAANERIQNSTACILSQLTHPLSPARRHPEIPQSRIAFAVGRKKKLSFDFIPFIAKPQTRGGARRDGGVRNGIS